MSKCIYCDGKIGGCPSTFLFDGDINMGELGDGNLSVWIDEDKSIAMAFMEMGKEIEIKYCPMCGRKLDPEALKEAADD